MKVGMMDVGIICKEPRFGISTEKGKSFQTAFCLNRVFRFRHKAVLCYVRLQHHQVPEPHPGPGGPQAELPLPVLHR